MFVPELTKSKRPRHLFKLSTGASEGVFRCMSLSRNGTLTGPDVENL